jgi:Zn-dependent protease
MLPTKKGSIHLFRFSGIDVFLHWSWFAIGALQLLARPVTYSSIVWNIGEYLMLFLIVLMHEFGHSLACRSVGGQADQIILWPLGGVAFVSPPQRPGATLWSIVAGPMVNVMLVPVFSVLVFFAGLLGGAVHFPNLYQFLFMISLMNGFILIFNLLPVYPLDGGQILRSLLWFIVGPIRSLMITSIIGLIGVVVLTGLLLLYSLLSRTSIHWMFFIIMGFIMLHCTGALLRARMMSNMAKAPQRYGYSCPACAKPPPIGTFWLCGNCRKPFDTFATRGTCPHCLTQFGGTICLECGKLGTIEEWQTMTR